MYLDFDTTPPLRSRYVRGLETASINAARRLMAEVEEGQVGIYANAVGDFFLGYVIKYPGQTPYFEPAEKEI